MLGMSEVCISSHIVRFLQSLGVPNAWIPIFLNEEGHVVVHYMLHSKMGLEGHVVVHYMLHAKIVVQNNNK